MSIKEQYWKYSLITLILGLGLILFIKISPFTGGILGACTLYIMMRKQMLYLTQKKHLKKGLAAILLLIETVLCFLVPLALAVWLLIIKIQTIDVNTAGFIHTITDLASKLHDQTGYNLLSTENISSMASILPAIGQFLMGSIGSFAVNAFVLIFVLYFMFIGGIRMEKYIYELLPFSETNKKNVLKEINMIVRSNAIGIPLLAVIQGGIATIGYYLFGVPSALLFGFFTCFATVIPIVGTALVWFPLATYLALSGEWSHAIGLLLYCGLIVTNIDNLIRFVLQKKMADTHPLITIFGVVIGLSLFGFMGIIFGPLLLSIFILCVNIFKTQFLSYLLKCTYLFTYHVLYQLISICQLFHGFFDNTTRTCHVQTHKANTFLTKHFPVIQRQMCFIYKKIIQIFLTQS